MVPTHDSTNNQDNNMATTFRQYISRLSTSPRELDGALREGERRSTGPPDWPDLVWIRDVYVDQSLARRDLRRTLADFLAWLSVQPHFCNQIVATYRRWYYVDETFAIYYAANQKGGGRSSETGGWQSSRASRRIRSLTPSSWPSERTSDAERMIFC